MNDNNEQWMIYLIIYHTVDLHDLLFRCSFICFIHFMNSELYRLFHLFLYFHLHLLLVCSILIMGIVSLIFSLISLFMFKIYVSNIHAK